MAETKTCTKCSVDKLLCEYTLHRGKPKSRCKRCEAIRVNDYRLKNYDLIKEKKKKYWVENRHRLLDAHNEKSRLYFIANPEKKKESSRRWAAKNRAKNIEYTRNRYNSDPEFNISIKHRRRIFMALKRIGAGRKDRMIELLGCDYAFFKKYIENRFTVGMNWGLILTGKIHLDHIKPCSKFDLLDIEQQKICFHYTNYQPMWATDNMKKHNKY